MSHPKIAAADHDVHELIRQRWSPRAFDSSRPVTRPDLFRLFEAARWAPSSFNEQPWRFVYVLRDESSEVWRALVAALAPTNQVWAAAAPVLVLAVVRLTLERSEAANALACYDAGQAVALLSIQATAQGLSVRQMEGFDPERAREACGVPAGFAPIVIMAIGYVGDPDALIHDKHRDAERKPRQRKSLESFVFEGKWGG